MKARDIIKAFCAAWNNCENCDYVDVPEYESEEEYREWAMGYYGFIPDKLKPGRFYLVEWGEEPFHTLKGTPEPDVFYDGPEVGPVRFYVVEL